jgi:hypothetical protein
MKSFDSCLRDIPKLMVELGFSISQFAFEDIIEDRSLRKLISGFSENDAAKLLIYSPDFFVMPGQLRGTREKKIKTAKLQTFFLRVLNQESISKKEFEVYEKYFKLDNTVLMLIDGKKKIVLAEFMDKVPNRAWGAKVNFRFPKKSTLEKLMSALSYNKKADSVSAVKDFENSIFSD